MHTDKLRWVDDEWKAELKATLKPNENQDALAYMLEHETGGDYHLLLTFSFRPNEYEEITQTVGEEYKRNMKVSWLEGERIVKRVGRDGQMLKGTRGISPGWGARAAERAVLNFVLKDPQLKKTRWFMCVEGSKFRQCAHVHMLVACSKKVQWEKVAQQWSERYGRFRVELVDDRDGMAMYLAKQYLGKEYGNEDYLYKFSRNTRRPQKDPVPKMVYQYRMDLFRNNMRSDPEKKAKMMRWKTFLQQVGHWG